MANPAQSPITQLQTSDLYGYCLNFYPYYGGIWHCINDWRKYTWRNEAGGHGHLRRRRIVELSAGKSICPNPYFYNPGITWIRPFVEKKNN